MKPIYPPDSSVAHSSWPQSHPLHEPEFRAQPNGQPTSRTVQSRLNNLLLTSISRPERERLVASSHLKLLHAGQVLQAAHQPIKNFYFMEAGLVSLSTVVSGCSPLEVACVGKEGLLGVSALFGNNLALHQAKVQIPGKALMIPFSVLQAEFNMSGQLYQEVGCYMQSLMAQITHSVHCAATYSVEKRISHWLLDCFTRLGRDELPVTHEQIGQILGIRRTSVTLALGVLREAGIVQCTRGSIILLDPLALAQSS